MGYIIKTHYVAKLGEWLTGKVNLAWLIIKKELSLVTPDRQLIWVKHGNVGSVP
jgi:hypothetical protein